MELFNVCVKPTEAEWLDGLKRSGLRRAGKGRLIVQTVVLAAVATVAAAAFFIDGCREPMSAVIAAAATLVIPVMWGLPWWRMRAMAKSAAEDGATVHLWVFEDGFDFGEQVTGAYYAFDAVRWALPTAASNSLVLRTKSDEVVVLPARCFEEEQWRVLTEKVGVPR